MDQMTKNALWYKKELEQTEVELRKAKQVVPNSQLHFETILREKDKLQSELTKLEALLGNFEKVYSVLGVKKLKSQLAQAVDVLRELKHLRHHSIEEEVWRIDNVLEDIERNE